VKLLERLHGEYVIGRRARVLADHLSGFIPEGCSVLDVGCGDGLIDRLIMGSRPDVRIRGIDTIVRPSTQIPVDGYDGTTIPHSDGAFDVVMLVDVLHHEARPNRVLDEAVRVARRAVVIKDVMLRGWLAGPTLQFMDRIANERHGVALPATYWTPQEWQRAIREAGLSVELWHDRIGLYPPPASWLFERSFHFVSRLVPAVPASAA
jgi:SAM-dependent methyltransferase